MDPSRFEWLSFDCYGTLIDWETGILKALRPVFSVRGLRPHDAELIEQYAKFETEEERVYKPYRDVLRNVVRRFAAAYNISLEEQEIERLPESLARWPAFADTPVSLCALQSRFKIAVISNIDSDLFAATCPKLGIEPDLLVTAELCKSYKPSPKNFKVALALMDADPRRVLHVAQSQFHDIAPARSLGLVTAWINRGSAIPGRGLAPAHPTDSEPDLEVPDLTALLRVMRLV